MPHDEPEPLPSRSAATTTACAGSGSRSRPVACPPKERSQFVDEMDQRAERPQDHRLRRRPGRSARRARGQGPGQAQLVQGVRGHAARDPRDADLGAPRQGLVDGRRDPLARRRDAGAARAARQSRDSDRRIRTTRPADDSPARRPVEVSSPPEVSQSDFVTRGQALVSSGQFQEAVKVCRLGLLGRPTTVEGRVVLGQALLALKRYDEVLAEMRVALELDHTSIAAQVAQGRGAAAQGRRPRRGRDARRAAQPGARPMPHVVALLGEAERLAMRSPPGHPGPSVGPSPSFLARTPPRSPPRPAPRTIRRTCVDEAATDFEDAAAASSHGRRRSPAPGPRKRGAERCRRTRRRRRRCSRSAIARAPSRSTARSTALELARRATSSAIRSARRPRAATGRSAIRRSRRRGDRRVARRARPGRRLAVPEVTLQIACRRGGRGEEIAAGRHVQGRGLHGRARGRRDDRDRGTADDRSAAGRGPDRAEVAQRAQAAGPRHGGAQRREDAVGADRSAAGTPDRTGMPTQPPPRRTGQGMPAQPQPQLPQLSPASPMR